MDPTLSDSAGTRPDAAPSSLPSAATVAVRRLDNGLLLAARENFTSPSVVTAGLLAVGGMDEAPAQSGLASLTASLLSRGTAHHDYDALNEAIENVGASVRFGGGTHTTSASVKCLSEDFGRMAALLVEMARQPTFPEDHLERVRAQRITALEERLTDTRAVADMRFYESAYPPSHPYHYDASGTPETVAALSRDDLHRFHAEHYGPAGGIFLVVGAIPQEEALDRLEALLGDWQPAAAHDPDRTAPPVAALQAPLDIFHPMPTKTQSDIVYGLPTVPRSHPDFRPLQLANTVLGVFGMMGRIGRSVRDEQGLAYYARSSLNGSLGPGAWAASAGVSPDKVEQAVRSIREEWVRLGTTLISEEELNDSKALLTGSLPLRLETNGGMARTLLDILYYDLGLDYLLHYEELVNSITPEEVRRVSATYFDPSRAVLAVAGPPLP